MKKENGFTLIELLVVIAIIGLLTTMCLVAIAHYRDEAKDSRIETALSQTRSTAALVYNEDSSYGGICTGVPLDTIDEANNALKTIKEEVKKFSGTDPVCHSSTLDYCVQSPLLNGGYYCVDSSGVAAQIPDSYCSGTNIKCTPL
jgi:prepilin-type N-terminal cleavage/methylation domain-containing protein